MSPRHVTLSASSAPKPPRSDDDRWKAVLGRDAKRWSLAQVSASDAGPSVLEYRLRPRKSVGIDGLRDHLLSEAAPHVVAADHAPDGRS